MERVAPQELEVCTWISGCCAKAWCRWRRNFNPGWVSSICLEHLRTCSVVCHVLPLCDTTRLCASLSFFALFWRAAKPRFFEGLLHLLLLDVPMWAIQTLKLLRPLRKETIQIAKDLDDLKQFLGYRADVVSMWETRQTQVQRPWLGCLYLLPMLSSSFNSFRSTIWVEVCGEFHRHLCTYQEL